jgi:N-formylmaleamate deformylase
MKSYQLGDTEIVRWIYRRKQIAGENRESYARRRSPLTEWSTGNCETNGINIHYTRTGGNKPPLILLHGLTANGACWTAVAHAIEGDYDVIMPDARGHGKSSMPDDGYRYEDLANDVVGLIEALRLPPPILIGHSMGGMTAAVVASRNPQLLRGLILADPTFLSPKVQREIRDSAVADQHRRDLNRSLADVVAEARLRHPDRSVETIELIARARFQTSMAAFDVLTPPNPDYRQVVSAIEVPSLLVMGGSAGVVSPDVAADLQRLNLRLQVEQIPEAGHGLQYDQPERFAVVVQSFLRAMGTVIVP